MDKAHWLAVYVWQHDGVTRDQILVAWSEYDDRGRRMAQSTFYDVKNNLEERYGLYVEKRGKGYHLHTRFGKIDPLLEQLIEQAAQERNRRTGVEWVKLLNEALCSNNVVEMEYSSVNHPEGYVTHFKPYGLRYFNGVYYVVGSSEHHGGAFRTFAVDRIRNASLTAQRFRRDGKFSVAEYFRNSYGAFGGLNVVPVEVVLRTTQREAVFLRLRPLHASQVEIAPADDNSPRFSLNVGLTEDFIRDIMGRTTAVVVESPNELRNEIRERAIQLLA